MKFNNKELVDLSFGDAAIEGRLHHKKFGKGYSHSVFKEKWFKLRANILFYFNLSETGQIFSEKPVGAYILENIIVQYEMNSEVPFSFSIYFNDEVEKKHLFSGRTQEYINKWAEALKQASYEYWRSQLLLLQEKLRLITGHDPLLMYPRNEGCRHVFEEKLKENSYKISNNYFTQNSKSQFYIKDKEEMNFNFSQSLKGSTKCSEKENQDSQNSSNGHSTVSPVRPARGIKQKVEVECAQLIDL